MYLIALKDNYFCICVPANQMYSENHSEATRTLPVSQSWKRVLS